MNKYYHFLAVAFVTAFSVWPLLEPSASASTETDINFCNKSEEKVYVAVGYKNPGETGVLARGWWGIESQKCSGLSVPLEDGKIYFHASSSSSVLQWVGDTALCVDTVNAFDLEHSDSIACNAADQEVRKFKELPVSDMPLVEGVRTIDIIPADATRIGGGLKFCNDTGEELYLSLGQKKASISKTTIDGWFSVKAGKCYETTRLGDADEVYYFANNANADKKWRGDVAFCTDDFDGYRFDDAAHMDCMKNNQRMQLFKKDKISPDGQFEHHFKASDADAVRSVVNLCNSRSEKNVGVIAWKNPEFAGQVITKGWYNLVGGECINDLAVDAEEILLYVENSDRTVLIDGPTEACVNDTKAFQYSRATEMKCDGADEIKAKFATKTIAAGKVRLDIP